MKLLGKILTLLGALAGVLFLVHRALGSSYKNVVERYVVFEEEEPQG